MTLRNTVKKKTKKKKNKLDIYKTFFQSYKTFCFFILIMYILFCCKNQKNMSQKEVQDLIFEVSLHFYIKQANRGKGDLSTHFRSSRSQIFFRIGVLKYFAIFAGKQLPSNFIKKRLQHGYFFCEYCEFF